MPGAIFAHGHWRRRDPLEGLSEPMRAALADADLGKLELGFGVYSAAEGQRCFAPATIRALAERGLLRRRAGPDGCEAAFKLTPAGNACVAEIRRRATVRLVIAREGRLGQPRASALRPPSSP